MDLAVKLDVKRLQDLAAIAIKRLEIPDHGWATQMPGWRSRGHPRGLLAWGESRVEGKSARRTIMCVCSQAVNKALDFYFRHVGLPPVKAGESRKKAIKAGRYTKDADSPRSPRGQTKGQVRLVEAMHPYGPINLADMFLLVVAAAYCHYLVPSVDDGTCSSTAVLGFFRDQTTVTKIMASVSVYNVYNNCYTYSVYPRHGGRRNRAWPIGQTGFV